MPDELTELWDTAIYREIASQAFYIAGQAKTQDPGAKALMKELAEEELKHSQWIKNLKEKGWGKRGWHQEKVPTLMISEYLTGSDKLEDEANYDASNKLVAFAKAQEWGERIPIGVIYKKELPTFEEQLPALAKEPLVKQQIKPKQIEGLLDEFM